MKTLFVILCSAALLSCGGPDKPTETATTDKPTNNPDMPPSDTTDGDGGASSDPPPTDKKDKVCQGFDLDLANALGQAACEVQPDPNKKPQDMKGRLEVKVAPLMTTVPSGKRTDLVVTFANKLPSSIDLDFVVDPLPRFVVEAYDAKSNKRVDLPAGNPPPPPKGVKRPDPAKPSIARVTIAANGTAKIVIPWEAVRTRWAPEKFAGTPPEMGYPRAPAGGLGKGKYRLKVVTPLTNVFEGIDKEVSAPKVEIAVN